MIDLINILPEEKKLPPVNTNLLAENLQYLSSKYPEKILFEMKEVATELNMTASFIGHYIKNGRIKSTDFGRRKMLHKNELARLLTEGVSYGY